MHMYVSRNIRAVLPLLAAIAGCIGPAPVNPTSLLEYQQHLVKVGPQKRLAGNLVRQAPGTTGAPLTLTKEEGTDRTLEEMSIEEAM
jgi:hypothetical protein